MIETKIVNEIIKVVMEWKEFETEEGKESVAFLISTVKNFLEVPKAVSVVMET